MPHKFFNRQSKPFPARNSQNWNRNLTRTVSRMLASIMGPAVSRSSAIRKTHVISVQGIRVIHLMDCIAFPVIPARQLMGLSLILHLGGIEQMATVQLDVERVRAYMAQQGLSERELAQQMGVAYSYVNRLLSGKRQVGPRASRWRDVNGRLFCALFWIPRHRNTGLLKETSTRAHRARTDRDDGIQQNKAP